MSKRTLCVLAVLLSAPQARAAAPDFVMVAPLNQAMPFAQFQKEKIVGGILKDMGSALAQRLGRHPKFISLPGEAVSAALMAGKADGICFVRPHWIDGDFDWSAPFMSDGETIASRPEAPHIGSLSDLRDRPVGTVASHRYPRIENVLGIRFNRVDSANIDDNMRKLLDGTNQHALMGQSTINYYLRGDKASLLRIDMRISTFDAQCAFSKKSDVPFADVDRAMNAMLKDGTVEKILARYR
jgi:polar amino acid transport system substrate-binding protein